MLVERAAEHSVIMTDEQIERLPNVCRVIVRHARDIETIASAPVVSFDNFKKQRELMGDYIRSAAKIFMPLSVRDGPLASV